MKIYWSSMDDMSLAYLPPEKLTDHIPKHLKYSEYQKCPAFAQKIKNTYVLRSPFDLDFTIDQNGVFCNNELIEKVNLENMGHKIMQMHMPYVFFAEESCEATMMHPYLHHNSFTDNGNTVFGQFDIGKWFRPMQAAFILKPSETYNFQIQRGDIFAYINFDSSNPVTLENFYPTQEIQSIMEKCLNLKKATKSVFSLDKCYESMLLYKHTKRLKQLLRG